MSGAVAERTTFVGYLCIAFFVSSINYPIFGRWAWNGKFEGVNLGWFRFNGGSTLKLDDTIPLILNNTSLSASCGSIATFLDTGLDFSQQLSAQMMGIVVCFLMNSLHHGFEGRDNGTIDIEASLKGEAVSITYRDNGSGISAKNLSHVFESFYTTKHGKGGSGLGLHIVYSLVTKTLSGEIKCESDPDLYTQFKVTFPITYPNDEE